MLRGVVSCPISYTKKPRNGGNVDNRAGACVEHLLPKDLCQKKWRHKIHLNHAAIVDEGGVFCSRNETNTGVVYQHISASETVEDRISKGINSCLIRHVSGVPQCFATIRFNGLKRLHRLVMVDDGKIVASLRE